MPVRVDIPIKIKTNHYSIEHSLSSIDDLLDASLTRSLTHSVEEVVEKRGGYVNVVLSTPEFNFIGEGAIRLTQQQKQALQDRVQEKINQIVATSGILDYNNTFSNTTTPLQTPAQESKDETRFLETLGVYAVPSYEGGGESEHVEVVNNGASIIVNQEYYTVNLAYSDIARNFRHSLSVMFPLYQSAVVRYGPPSGELGGLLWKSGANRFTFFIQHMQTQRWQAGDIVILAYRADRRGSAIHWGENNQGLPTLIASATYHNVSEVEALHRRYHGSFIRSAIERNMTRPETMTREHYRALLDRAVDLEVQRRARLIIESPHVNGIVVLDFASDVLIGAVGINSEHAWQGAATLFPVLHEVEVPPDQGDREGGEGNAGDGDGEGQGAQQGRGGIVASGDGDGSGALYPTLASGSGSLIRCQSFLGEPTVEALDRQGELINTLIGEIATRLQIDRCDYAGNFLINAADVIASRASDIGNYAVVSESNQPGFFTITPDNSGNTGVVNFLPNASPAIQFLRFLAGTVPLITRLSHILDRTYTLPEFSAKFSGTAQNKPYFWLLRFHSDLRDKMELAVGTIFIMSCRVLMMQFLATSQKAIDDRINNFANYAPLFEQLMLGEMADIHELRTLSGRLSRQIAEENGQRSVVSDIGESVMLTWNSAKSGISDLFNGYNPIEEDIVDNGFIKRDGKTVGIIDSNGHRWTTHALESTLAIRSNIAESVDPLVKQIRDIPELMNRFRQNPNAIRMELFTLLIEMRDSNSEVRGKVVGDRTFAFEASKIQEHLQTATIPGTHYPLQGIHLQVHQQIGEFFRGDTYYALGINALFGRELGFSALKEFFLFTGLILLAVVCAPLAVAVGAGVALYEYGKAQERLQVFRALIEPEVVMSQAELEAELFAAELGLALSFIPYAGRVLGTSVRVGKVVVRNGVRGSARVFARYGSLSRRQIGRTLTREGAHQVARSIRGRFTRQLAERLKHGFVYAVVRELAEDQLMDVLLQKLLFGPALQRIYSDFQDYTPTAAANTGTILQAPADVQRLTVDTPEVEE